MCDIECEAAEATEAPSVSRRLSRRRMLGTIAASAAAATTVPLVAGTSAWAAQPTKLSVTLLGTKGGPSPLPGRYGTSTALVVNDTVYVIDCGEGAVSQYMRAGLSRHTMGGIFLTHLHSDHTVDYFSFPLLSGRSLLGPSSGNSGSGATVPVYGPGPAGSVSTVPDAPGPLPGTAALTALANQAFSASTNFFIEEDIGLDPTSVLDVHEIVPPSSAGASVTNTAPAMKPFVVMEDDNVRVTAILVPHGAVFPAYAYRFDTDYGSVVFSGDTARTPNIPTLAHRANLIVHEAADFRPLGQSPVQLKHNRTAHTNVAVLGQVAVESEAQALVTTHFVPGDPTVDSDAFWRQALCDSARSARYRGELLFGADLLTVPVKSSRSH